MDAVREKTDRARFFLNSLCRSLSLASHLDIAGSTIASGQWNIEQPTAAPIVALAGRYLVQ